jgi:hypothetical protein
MVASLLTVCLSFSWWIKTSIASAFLLGEYPYPQEEDFE